MTYKDCQAVTTVSLANYYSRPKDATMAIYCHCSVVLISCVTWIKCITGVLAMPYFLGYISSAAHEAKPA